MKVLLDVKPLLQEKLSGIGVYAKHLFHGLKDQGAEVVPVYKASRMFKTNFIEKHIGVPGKVLSHMTSFFYDEEWVIHATDFTFPLKRRKYKRVSTVHDLGVYREDLMDPGFASRGRHKITKMVGQSPNAIVVPSEFTKSEFIGRFPDYRDKTFVVHHGCDHLVEDFSGHRDFVKKVTTNPYILFVGNLEKRKNIMGAIRAFEFLKKSMDSLDFVVVGGDGFGAEEVHRTIDQSPVSKSILRLGHTEEKLLKSLYQQAQCFLYPSLYEGFGMPIIEAMMLGTPVVTSRATSTMEVSGGATHLVDPDSPEDIAHGVQRILTDSNYRAELILSGSRHCQTLSWKKSARQTIEVYKSLHFESPNP